MAAFLFDLDMTLLNTAALDAWRRVGMWPRVMSNLERAKTFPSDPHQIPEKLKEQGHCIAVVTASPSRYAKALLEQFEITYDVLVAYHDTERHKPDPEPLEKALEQLGTSPDEAYHVGDSPNDTEASYHAGVVSIGAGWGVRDWTAMASSAPDILLFDPKRLLKEESFSRLGYLAEVYPGEKPLWHEGSVLPLGTPEGYALGRYFVSSDPRHSTSALSQSILSFKNDDEHAFNFARMLGVALRRLDVLSEHSSIVSVPPKPEQANRFEEMFYHLTSSVAGEAVSYDDGLLCVRDPGNLKNMNRAEREKAVRRAFRTEYDWDGDGVIIVDDVLTTSATISECSRVLQKGQASHVICMVIGRDQHLFANKYCPECESKMVVRTNRKTQERFWGCSSYPDCRHSESIDT